MAAFWGMYVKPAKHSSVWLTFKKKVWLPERQTHRRMDRQTLDKVIPMCCYASQATQKGSVWNGGTMYNSRQYLEASRMWGKAWRLQGIMNTAPYYFCLTGTLLKVNSNPSFQTHLFKVKSQNLPIFPC